MTDLPRVEQLPKGALATMTPDEITTARQAGKLATVLGGRAPVVPPTDPEARVLGAKDLGELLPDEVDAYRRAGMIEDVPR